MKLTRTTIIGIVAGLAVMVVALIFFRDDKIFLFLLGIGVLVLIIPFFITLIMEGNREKERNEQFLEFSRNLAESVKTGTPIGKSIINMSQKNYGSLTEHIRKLANQISLGIPINKAFDNFADDVDNVVVRRAVTLIQEAESAGGEIDYILDSVAESISQIEKLKKERKNAVSNLVVQGYIIFLIFVGIMLVMQYRVLPLTSGITGIGDITNAGSIDRLTEVGQQVTNEASAPEDPARELAKPFLYLLLTQGLFAGLVIGKISEGRIKSGFRHSIVLVLSAFLIWSGANAFL